MSRFRDALAIDGGAGNLVAIANSFAKACKEAMDEERSTEAVWRDPAVRLIVNQMVYLTKVGEGLGHEDYLAAYNQCTERKEIEDAQRANALRAEELA
jgi:hypothetical protein